MNAPLRNASDELVEAGYSISCDERLFAIDGKIYRFSSRPPFPLIEINGVSYAEREQILKHAESKAPFVPDWAERELERKPINGKEIYTTQPERSDASEAELGLLRNFFDAWQALHAIPNDKFHRRKKEDAAVVLTNAAQSVIRYRNPVNGN